MIIQTGSAIADLLRKGSVARPDMIDFPQKFNGVLDSTRTGVRTEVTGFVLFHVPGKQNPRIIFSHRNLDVRIGFVILEHGIIPRSMLFDQITFQNQGFQFWICHDVFKIADMRHHLFYFCSTLPACLKILAYPVFQTDGFSDINNLFWRIMHKIDSRTCRELF